MSNFFNYMPATASEDEMRLANEICARESVSDATKRTNAQKWTHVQEVYRNYECNLFSAIDYDSILKRDSLVECEAASFVAELRSQFLEEVLRTDATNSGAHILYLINRIWYVRLRERVDLHLTEKAMKKMRLT